MDAQPNRLEKKVIAMQRTWPYLISNDSESIMAILVIFLPYQTVVVMRGKLSSVSVERRAENLNYGR